MWSSPLFWIVFSIAIFWALGAYNRLMRLRSAVVQAFGSLDAHIVRQVALLGEFGAAYPAPAAVPGQGASQPMPPHFQELAALQGATTQLSASLAVARARPLQASAIAALAAAREVLQASWSKALQATQAPSTDAAQEASAVSGAGADVGISAAEAAPSPASPLAPALWQTRWEEHVLQNDHAIRVFNEAVVHYNGAIAQFPANLLAWVFGFKAARAL